MSYLPTTYDNYGFFRHTAPGCSYLGYKPASYSDSAPMTLFVWTHGCGGQAEGDMWAICPNRSTQKYIAISIGGRDGACWNADVDYTKILAAIEDVKKYFNVGKVILGGYSSGGDISYYTAFFHSDKVAGVVINNSSPFLDSGSASQSAKLAAAKHKFNVYQMSHTNDTTYKIATVKAELQVMRDAGFPVQFIELPGTHWDSSTSTSGTNYDFAKYAIPLVNDNNWQMPGTIPPVIVPPTSKTLEGFSAPSNKSVVAPGGQGRAFTRVVPDGYDNVAKGSYTLSINTYVTSSWSGAFGIDIVFTNNNAYDMSWSEITLDLRNHTLASSGQCTVSGNTGLITIKPVSNNSKIPSMNKASLNLYITRSKTATDNYYQVLVKSIKW